MVKNILKDAEDRMHKAAEILRQELAKIRTGKATTALLDGVKVDYYGTPTHSIISPMSVSWMSTR